MQIAEAYVALSARGLPNVTAAIGAIQRKLTDFTGSLRSAASAAQASLGSIAQNAVGVAAGNGISALMSQVAGLGRALVGGNAQFEQYEISMGTLLKSADKAKTRLAELEQFAANTPFELPQLVKVEQSLLNFGFAAKSTQGMLEILGDQASVSPDGMEQGIERITRALGQMKAKTKVSAGEMLQLTEAGIPAWDMLAKKLGKTTAEVMKLSEAGQISADVGIAALLEGMKSNTAGNMEKQSKSLTGMLSSMRDGIAAAGRKIGEPIFESFKGSIGNINAWLSSSPIQEGIQALGKSFGSLIERAQAVWRSIAATMGPVLARFGGLSAIATIAGNAVVGALSLVAGPALAVAAGFAAIGAKVMAVGAIARPIISAIAGMIASNIDTVLQWGESITNIGVNIATAIGSGITWLGEWAAELMGMAGFTSETVTGIGAHVSAVLDTIQVLTSNLGLLWEITWQTMAATTLGIVDSIVNGWRVGMAYIGATLNMAYEYVSRVFMGIGASGYQVASNIGQSFAILGDNIAEVFARAYNVVVGIIREMAHATLSIVGALSLAFGGVFKGLTAKVEELRSTVNNTLADMKTGEFKNPLANPLAGAGDAFGKGANFGAIPNFKDMLDFGPQSNLAGEANKKLAEATAKLSDAVEKLGSDRADTDKAARWAGSPEAKAESTEWGGGGKKPASNATKAADAAEKKTSKVEFVSIADAWKKVQEAAAPKEGEKKAESQRSKMINEQSKMVGQMGKLISLNEMAARAKPRAVFG